MIKIKFLTSQIFKKKKKEEKKSTSLKLNPHPHPILKIGNMVSPVGR